MSIYEDIYHQPYMINMGVLSENRGFAREEWP